LRTFKSRLLPLHLLALEPRLLLAHLLALSSRLLLAHLPLLKSRLLLSHLFAGGPLRLLPLASSSASGRRTAATLFPCPFPCPSAPTPEPAKITRKA
jgi:hypothetical protein